MTTNCLQSLFNHLKEGAIALTPNHRLATTLQTQFITHQSENNNHKSWPTAQIFPLNTWLKTTFETIKDNAPNPMPITLPDTAQTALWHQILEKDQSNLLLNIKNTAQSAQKCHALIHDFNLIEKIKNQTHVQDTEIFLTWMSQFKKICQNNNWLPTALIPNFLQKCLEENTFTPPQTIIMVSFDDITPATQDLLDALKSKGTTVIEFNTTQIKSCQSKRIFNDQDSEIKHMLHWVKRNFDENKTIGCAIPNLNELRDTLSHYAQEILPPHMLQKTNISGGKPLNQYPIIQTALNILKCHHPFIKTKALCTLLRSPYFLEGFKDRIHRAKIERQLQTKNIITIHCQTLENQQSPIAKSLIPFIKALPAGQQSFNKHSKMSPTRWAQTISNALKAASWPGDRSLQSEEFQLVKKWHEVLTQFSALSSFIPEINSKRAIELIEDLTQNTLFQSQTGDTHIQILGLLETAGLTFDKLWVMGLNDETIPMPPNPNPFLPMAFQKKYNLPHASYQRELRYSETLLNRLSHSAHEIVYSYAIHTTDMENELRPSPLISHISTQNSNLKSLPQGPNEITYNAKDLENLQDFKGPKIGPNETIKGGSFILKSMAACPMKAFLEYRLNALSENELQEELTALEKGTMVHKILEIIWTKIKTQEALLALSKGALLKTITQAVQKALAATPIPFSKKSRSIHLEKKRLIQITWDWLALEKERPPFKVTALEKEETYNFEGLSFRLKMDRLDQTSEGPLIMDYKTGLSTPSSWFGERPDEPQLPLYATVSNQNPVGIAFAQIRTGAHQFKGVMQNHKPSNLLNPTPPSEAHWQALKSEWQQNLTTLVKDFKKGDASIDPKYGIKTCRYCHLASLCRVGALHDEA